MDRINRDKTKKQAQSAQTIVIDSTLHPITKQLFKKLGKVVVLDLSDISKPAKERDAQLKTATIVVIRSRTRITAEFLAKAPQLRIVATATSGVDHIDTAAVQKRNITVVSAQGKNSDAVADYVFRVLFHLTDDVVYTSNLLKSAGDFVQIKKNNKIKAAALDVFCNEPKPSKLYELPNTLCTPHIAGNTEEGKLQCAKSVFEQVEKLVK